MVGLQRLHGCRGNLEAWTAHFATETVEEIVCQCRDVRLPVAQRRQGDGHDVEPIVQVLAKGTALHGLTQSRLVAASRRTLARMSFTPPNALKFLVLHHAQELGLQVGRQIANFIQEDRAAVRHLELPLLLCRGACEGTLFMAKQLAGQQLWGERHAIDRHKGLLGAWTPLMQSAGHDFFAGAAFAYNRTVVFVVATVCAMCSTVCMAGLFPCTRR